jgi:uncharacterized protein YidB (DUF937 family)
MDIGNIAQELISQKLGDSVDTDTISDALKGLLGGENGSLDLSSIISSVTSNADMGSMISSWLGDGENMPLNGDALSSLFGSEKIEEFASKLGIDSDNASSLLSDVVPNLVDKTTSGEDMLSGGLEDAFKMAKSFF